jgi:undecaprenyl-diphosphatase
MDGSFLFFQALLLGIVQGVTEFLPVSSSAHLILIPWLFQWNNPLIDSLTFDVVLHAATLLAILGYFWKDWVSLIRGFFRIIVRQKVENPEERLVFYIILATIPAVIAGFSFQKMIEESFRSASLIVWPLIAVSFLMIYAERRTNPACPLNNLKLRDALFVGFAQALALLPGVSRSGITITAGILRGYEREGATRFSFLLSTPAIAGATIFQVRHLFSTGMVSSEWAVLAAGFCSAGLSGYLAIAFLMRYLKRHTLNVFAGYRLFLAAAIIFWIYFKG